MPYYWEPLPSIVYLDIKSKASDDTSDADVSNMIGGVLYELDDPDFDPVQNVVEQAYAMLRDMEAILNEKMS